MAWKYSIPFFFLATVPLGYALGGAGTFLTPILLPFAMLTCDAAFGDETPHASAKDTLSYRLLTWLYIPLQIAATLFATIVVALGVTSFLEAVGLALSAGLTAGIFGFIAAHEMVHSPHRGERALGLALLASVLYMHFSISHVYAHHVRAATPDDAATARRGESVYGFVLRSARGQMAEAWNFEAARLGRKAASALSWRNRVLCYLGIEGLILLAMAALGWRGFVFFLGQSLIAIFMLEIFNYVAHYGLVRARLPSGGWERLGPQHSWNSSRRMNNAALFNMGRHSDHHRVPARAYQCLEALEGARELPTGYAGAILMALIPPLWRKVMDPRLAPREPLRGLGIEG